MPTRSPGTRRIDRTAVLEAALRLVDQEGLPALTMRRLATDLDVGVMTLYSYVRTKEELTGAVLTLALQDMHAEEHPDGPWDQRLADAARRLHRALLAHPGATQILVTGADLGPTVDPMREHMLSILLPAGFSAEQAVNSLNAIYCYVVGFTAVASLRSGPSRAEEDRVAGLPREAYPYLSGAAPEFARRFSDESFEFGLAQILTGLRS